MGLEGLAALRDGLMEASEGAVAETCERIRAEGAALCPVQTGQLRQSIHAGMQTDGGDARGTVTAGAKYASAVELGTYAQAARPFLHPAFLLHAGELSGLLAQRIKGLL